MMIGTLDQTGSTSARVVEPGRSTLEPSPTPVPVPPRREQVGGDSRPRPLSVLAPLIIAVLVLYQVGPFEGLPRAFELLRPLFVPQAEWAVPDDLWLYLFGASLPELAGAFLPLLALLCHAHLTRGR
ncbi:hypothetical protein [Actinoalloteichus hymeniacidonis]|uniref:Uncharacterized protein n=1 Tax=Actinoalloteichus hymeniacidonis TaxID=340345 RepID=A0AAC9MYG9_9PSEU|nr:hypothetical protein [Actinoalloteichus hymeniacidonis]AOS63449.1 hypothetical protein TL08_13175 [Actinoalloteichus hymeniacidonis]MBB5908509.1 hypothetical protein [Actinoalloteichus hymeniacidonis]